MGICRSFEPLTSFISEAEFSNRLLDDTIHTLVSSGISTHINSSSSSSFLKKIYFIYEHTIPVFRHTRRGCQIPLQMVVSHDVVAGIWTQDLQKSCQCSYPLSHLTSPRIAFNNTVSPFLSYAQLFRYSYLRIILEEFMGIQLCLFVCLFVCLFIDWGVSLCSSG